MSVRKTILALTFGTAALCSLTLSSAFAAEDNDSLSTRQQSIVAIAANTGRGDLEQLKIALVKGLDAGMTVNEIKEVLMHAYAYCGFPRSLRALQTFMAVLDERKAQGIEDNVGRDITPITQTGDKFKRGAEILSQLSGAPIDAPKAGYAKFAPTIEVFLKEHLFCDIFERDLLTWSERELATVAILAALGNVEPMLNSHSKIAMYQGLSQKQLDQMLQIVGVPNTDQFARGQLMENNPNFSGKAWLQNMVTAQDGYFSTVANVTFEPGCRNNWHRHDKGQILLSTSGKGYYQERGKPIQLLLPGDVVKIAPNVEHWHGAAPDSEFAHIALGAPDGKVTWLEPVSDADYNSYQVQK